MHETILINAMPWLGEKVTPVTRSLRIITRGFPAISRTRYTSTKTDQADGRSRDGTTENISSARLKVQLPPRSAHKHRWNHKPTARGQRKERAREPEISRFRRSYRPRNAELPASPDGDLDTAGSATRVANFSVADAIEAEAGRKKGTKGNPRAQTGKTAKRRAT